MILELARKTPLKASKMEQVVSCYKILKFFESKTQKLNVGIYHKFENKDYTYYNHLPCLPAVLQCDQIGASFTTHKAPILRSERASIWSPFPLLIGEKTRSYGRISFPLQQRDARRGSSQCGQIGTSFVTV